MGFWTCPRWERCRHDDGSTAIYMFNDPRCTDIFSLDNHQLLAACVIPLDVFCFLRRWIGIFCPGESPWPLWLDYRLRFVQLGMCNAYFVTLPNPLLRMGVLHGLYGMLQKPSQIRTKT